EKNILLEKQVWGPLFKLHEVEPRIKTIAYSTLVFLPSSQWKENYPALSRLAVGQTLTVNQLIDMEWKFGVTAGSSELEKVGSIFLQLKLVIKKGSRLEPVYLELTLPQFYSFLHEMERIKTSLESLG
uniref:COMM domain containing 7 n=1 Tax=Pseudonaja textilis TaxID=8673 RepID=A0A670Z577_PSETE